MHNTLFTPIERAAAWQNEDKTGCKWNWRHENVKHTEQVSINKGKERSETSLSSVFFVKIVWRSYVKMSYRYLLFLSINVQECWEQECKGFSCSCLEKKREFRLMNLSWWNVVTVLFSPQHPRVCVHNNIYFRPILLWPTKSLVWHNYGQMNNSMLHWDPLIQFNETSLWRQKQINLQNSSSHTNLWGYNVCKTPLA